MEDKEIQAGGAEIAAVAQGAVSIISTSITMAASIQSLSSSVDTLLQLSPDIPFHHS